MKQCPYCAEAIQDAAIVCKHCGRDIKIKADAQTRACPFCSNGIQLQAKTCPSCGEDVSAGAPVTATAKPTVNLLVGLFVLTVVGVVISVVAYKMAVPTAPVATANQTQEEAVSIERKLATIDCACEVSENDVQALRFRSLLQQLSAKYGETPIRVADLSTYGRNSLHEKGISESIANIMEGMNQVLDRPIQNSSGIVTSKLPDYLALYIVNRNGGKSHAEAISDLRVMLSTIGLQ